MSRTVASLALLGIASVGLSATYSFIPMVAEANGRVIIKIDKPSKQFHMCAWAPGDYEIFNYGKFIQAITFRLDGSKVSAQKGDDPNTWLIPGGADEVEYIVKPSAGNFSPNLRVKPGETLVSGPGVFGWFTGHDRERHDLRVSLLPAGSQAYTTLERKSGSKGWANFSAPNFDELIDAPLVIGDSVRVAEFKVGGKLHRIIAFGNNQRVDIEGFARVATGAVDGARSIFKELPYPQYAFFLDFNGQGGGLEHLNSTRIGIGANTTPERASGILFHEYFHAFNVKRIRSKVLGPFDYTKPAITGALWWLEGVTDYYASLLEFRCGLTDVDGALRGFSREIGGLQRTNARLTVSADEASRRVWETNGSFGFGGLSYYNKGHVLGIFLDLAIRGNSKGKHSLDDVMRALYAECKGKSGFEEGRIKELCIQYGGANLTQLYNTGVMKAGDLPWNEVLPLVGLRFVDGVLAFDPAADAQTAAIGRAWLTREE